MSATMSAWNVVSIAVLCSSMSPSVIQRAVGWSSPFPRSHRTPLKFLSLASIPSPSSDPTQIHDPSTWKGATHSSSHFATHVTAGDDNPTVQDAIASVLTNQTEPRGDQEVPPTNNNLSPQHLLQLGSVWFLPASASKDPNLGQKPIRLSLENASQQLEKHDYLRIHHTPRRFPQVHNFDWANWYPSSPYATTTNGVIVAQGDGFWVIDKPANIPVHPTVDNVLENVASQIRIADGGYVSTPQRLDQNTSGLFVVARSKDFAAYYAALLRNKTDQVLSADGQEMHSGMIQKVYSCLLCIIPQTSVAASYQKLKNLTVLKHYLEPSVRAPKYYAREPGNDTWAESLMRVKKVGQVYPLVGSPAAERLAEALWNSKTSSIPTNCLGVVEAEVELLTGRTHQIRGQFSAEGFPLVGDNQYGGGSPTGDTKEQGDYYIHSERLGLQCSKLRFLDPDIVENGDGERDLMPSSRWNSFHLDKSWWTPLLEMYSGDDDGCLTSSRDLVQSTSTLHPKQPKRSQLGHPDLLPPRVSLAPGANKYVLVNAVRGEDDLWFVKSASPSECGGPYHANVAEELVEWLEILEFDTRVTGGGRILYDGENGCATVYGFSYGFGKGDHPKAAELIAEHTNISASHDNFDGLY